MIGMNPGKTTEIETKTSKENIPDTSCFNTNFHIHTSLKVINFSKAWNYIFFISIKTQCVLFLKPFGIRISIFMRHPMLKQQGGRGIYFLKFLNVNSQVVLKLNQPV
ncbi:hypothetical protein ABEI56_01915 [Peribacillus castrilensis]|uniref:hypothetical protein n=1 Tax=Peribacillus castrilensis TaxID=2897690 RepID=UPI003D2B9F3D